MEKVKSKTKTDVDIYINEKLNLEKLAIEILDGLIMGIVNNYIDIVNNRSSPKTGT